VLGLDRAQFEQLAAAGVVGASTEA
jgi:hypothetical protein